MVIKTGNNKKSISVLCALCALFAAIICLFATGIKSSTAKAEQANPTVTQINKLETIEGNILLLYLTKCDYMTAEEWGTDSNEAYKWVASLDYADRANYNVHNALLNKNLSEYNYGEYILIDGEPIAKDEITLHANRYTRVNTLGFDFSSAAVLASVQEITFKAGCQLPTLTYSYFGEGEFSCLTLEEDITYKKVKGSWSSFTGYEEGVTYDADEKNFRVRAENSSFKGHSEAATTHFITAFSDNGWAQESGFTLTSEIAAKGDLIVLEFINPINAAEFGSIELNVFSNVPRSFTTHNAYEVTETSLGENLQFFSIAGREAPTFTKITLLSELYADENGMVDTVVLRVVNDGSELLADNCFYVGSFSCLPLQISGLVYDDSFFIIEREDAYDLTFRFNAKGEFTGKETLDLSKIFVNGESVSDINRKGEYATARWAAVQGIYQINVSLLKTYEGAAAIKNADLDFVGNNMQIAKGVRLPDGTAIDRDYTCHIYHNERIVSYEMMGAYEDVRVAAVSARLDPNPDRPQDDPNIHFMITFDKPITSLVYYHASQTEAWRKVSLITMANMYNENISAAYIAGGFKAALFDKVFINGKNLGELQALDCIPTATLVHLGQLNEYTMDLSIDCFSDIFKSLYPMFHAGEDITIEIKAGMKFTTGVKTAEDFSCVVNGYTVTTEKETPVVEIFYDGKRVEEGDVLTSNTKLNPDNLYVRGVENYSVIIKSSADGSLENLIITYGEETFTFAVRQVLTNEIPEDKEEGGCASSLSFGGVTALAMVALAVLAVRRKTHE